MQFILLDLLNGLTGAPSVQRQDSTRQSSSGIGAIYSGEMPPMAWIQQQQRVARNDASLVADANRVREQGNTAFREGDTERAIQFYSEAIDLDPNSAVNFSNRSLAYHRVSNFRAAVADAKEAIRLDPHFFKAHFRLGSALLSLNEFAEAHHYLQFAFENAQSNEDKESISILLQKCEAKLARPPAPFSPTKKTPEAVLASSLPSSFVGREGESPLVPNTPLLPPPPPPRSLIDIIPLLQEVSSQRVKEQGIDLTQCEALKCLFDPQRTARIRSLLAAADPEKLSRAATEAEEAQSQLRKRSRQANRSEFQATLSQRDELMKKLWQVAGDAAQAIGELQKMARDEQAVLGSLCNQSTSACEEAQKQWELTTPEPAQLATLIHRLSDLDNRLGEMRQATLRTDTAFSTFVDALRAEQRTFVELQPNIDERAAIRESIIAAADFYSKHGNQCSELVPSKMEALESLASSIQRIEGEAAAFHKNGDLGPKLLVEEARLERERLLNEKQRIQLQAEIEWMKVRDEEPSRIDGLTHRLEEVRCRISAVAAQQTEIQRRILALVEGDHPELAWQACGSNGTRIMKLAKGSGLWMHCSLSDFQIISTVSATVNSKVYHAKSRTGEDVAIKEIAIDGEKARRRFQNEINITIGSANHPNIIKVIGVFFDGPFAYIVMPHLKRGTLKTLLSRKEPLPWYRIQEIFRQIASGLSHLHERGIVHADMKPSNILFTDQDVPVIADFGIARDYGMLGERSEITMTQTTTISGTLEFMAPELLAPPVDGHQKGPSPKSDVWSLGVTMYTVAALNAHLHDPALEVPSMPVLLPGSTCVAVNQVTVGGLQRLADLISTALTVDPNNRPNVTEILSHPFFAVSLVQDLVDNRELVESNAKLEALRSYIHVLRAGCRNPVLVSVVRNHMMDSVTNIFDRLEEAELLRPIMVVFQGEQGVDEGALTTEMFTQYFQQLVTKHKVLISSHGGEDSESEGEAALVLGAEYTISADPRIPERHLVTLGKVLLKCIVENRPLPLQLNAAVLKYIVGTEPTLHDLETYDRVLAQSIKRLLLLSSEDLNEASLDFYDFPQKAIEAFNAAHGTDYTTETKVTSKNVKDYVTLRVKYELIGKREEALSNVKKGFMMSPLLAPHIKLLGATELMMLLCGQQHLHPSVVIDALDFQGFPPSSLTPQLLKDMINSFSQNNLRRFLRLCTASVSIPHGGLPRKIKVLCTADVARLPVGHACVYQLDFPDYNDATLIREKLALALAHVNDGFHIA